MHAGKRLALGAIGTALVFAILTPPAVAAPAVLTLDGDEVTLEKVDSGGWKTSVGLTNITDGDVTLVVSPKTAPCTLKPDRASVPRATHVDVAVSIPETCGAASTFAFTVGAQGGTPFDVTAASGEEDVDWTPLMLFLVAPFVAGAFVLLVHNHYRRDDKKVAMDKPLKGLDASWSFGDSWVSNVTAASGLVVAVLGSSDLLTEVLGENAKSAIAVTTVAGVIALGLVAVAGVLVLAIRRPEDEEVTVGGLLAGSSVALGAAGGQVWAVSWVLQDVDLGIPGWCAWLAAVLATLLLLLYTNTSLTGILLQGTKPDGQELAESEDGTRDEPRDEPRP